MVSRRPRTRQRVPTQACSSYASGSARAIARTPASRSLSIPTSAPDVPTLYEGSDSRNPPVGSREGAPTAVSEIRRCTSPAGAMLVP